MKTIITLALAAAIASSATPASAVTNLITNGSFELGTNPGASFIQVNGPNSSTVTNWAVSSGSQFKYTGTLYDASAGLRSIDLSGTGGTLFQSVSGLSIGAKYTVSFDLSNRPGASVPAIVSVGGNGLTPATFTFGGNPVTASNMGWERYGYTFMATQALHRISFTNANLPANRPYGPVIDNVIMTATIPEPQTWALLVVGFGLVGFAARRHRTVVSA